MQQTARNKVFSNLFLTGLWYTISIFDIGWRKMITFVFKSPSYFQIVEINDPTLISF